jgi:uncharacterized protein (DUF58 family)
MRLSATAPRSFALAVVLGVLASSLSAQTPNRGSARDVSVRIETDRSAYRIGDSITVRLVLRNVSSHPVRFVDYPPNMLARLRVYDADGQEVEATYLSSTQRASGSTHRIKLKPGEELTLHWLGREWLNLKDWGYDLRVPGKYSIVGIPGVGDIDLTPDYKTVRSNRATFTLGP